MKPVAAPANDAKDDASAARPFSLREARELVADLFGPDPALYWLDMTLSAAVGWGAMAWAIGRDGFDAWHVFLVLVSAFAFLRAVLFIHELSHLKKGALRGFALGWNLLVGVPMLLPSFTYVGSHGDHHKRPLYGTKLDPEYLPLGQGPRWRVALFLLETPIVPALLVLRFGLLTPLSWAIPPLRRVVVARMSSLVINPAYVRRAPAGSDRRAWIVLEALVLAWIVAVVAALATGWLPWRAVVVWYAVAAGVAFINQVRTLAAHLYDNAAGEALTTEGQLLDSVNVRGVPFVTDLVFPVGLKYHALHHLLPDLPYHALPIAHVRLMRELPDDSPYRRTEHASFAALLMRFCRRRGASDSAPATSAVDTLEETSSR